MSNRVPTFTAFLALILFMGASLHHGWDKLPTSMTMWNFQGSDHPTFFDIALKHGTDKVTTHNYQQMYDKYFPVLRDRPVKMLEIGLGCDMSYGPGASYYTWLEYFPHVDLYYIEYDAACARAWAGKATGATIFAGDQADVAFLAKFIRESGGDFDIIIDDGGHTMDQQITSLTHLWKTVKPGGVYFCEDLQTSYMEQYGGGSAADAGKGKMTMTQLIAELIDDLHAGPRKHEISEDMISVDCSKEICGFWKGGAV